MLLFNVFIQNTYVSLHLFTNSILLYIIIYKAVFLVPVVEVPSWCQWWRCLPGASGGGASRLVVVSSRMVEVPPWCQLWRCLPGASGEGASMVPAAAFLVPVVEVPPWCRWLPGSSPAYSQPDT